MAALQRPAPPLRRMESDRPIRAGRCDMWSAVITALSREEPGGGLRTPARSQQDPSLNKHDEHDIPTCHQEQLAVIPAEREQ